MQTLVIDNLPPETDAYLSTWAEKILGKEDPHPTRQAAKL